MVSSKLNYSVKFADFLILHKFIIPYPLSQKIKFESFSILSLNHREYEKYVLYTL